MNVESLQNQAWKLREEGKPIDSLAINYSVYHQQAIENDWPAASNTLIDISIAWSVLGRETGNPLHFRAAYDSVASVGTSSIDKPAVPQIRRYQTIE